jgi:hypothetical protein
MQIQLVIDSLIQLRKSSLLPADAPSTSNNNSRIDDYIRIINQQIKSDPSKGLIHVNLNLMTNDPQSLLEQTEANILILFRTLYSQIQQTLIEQEHPSYTLDKLTPLIMLDDFPANDPILASIFSTEEYVSLVQHIEAQTGYWFSELKKNFKLGAASKGGIYNRADCLALETLISSLLTHNKEKKGLLNGLRKNIPQNAFVIIKRCFFELVGLLSEPTNNQFSESLKDYVSLMKQCLEVGVPQEVIEKILATNEYRHFLVALQKFMGLSSINELKISNKHTFDLIVELEETRKYDFVISDLRDLVTSWVTTPGQPPITSSSRDSLNWLLRLSPTQSFSSSNSQKISVSSEPASPSSSSSSKQELPLRQPVGIDVVPDADLDIDEPAIPVAPILNGSAPVPERPVDLGFIPNNEQQKLLNICDKYKTHLENKLWAEISDYVKQNMPGFNKESIFSPENKISLEQAINNVWISKCCPGSIASIDTLRKKRNAMIEIKERINNPNTTNSELQAYITQRKEDTLEQHRDNAFVRSIGILLSMLTFVVTYPIALGITGKVWGHLMDSRGETACNDMLEILKSKPAPEAAPKCGLGW